MEQYNVLRDELTQVCGSTLFSLMQKESCSCNDVVMILMILMLHIFFFLAGFKVQEDLKRLQSSTQLQLPIQQIQPKP